MMLGYTHDCTVLNAQVALLAIFLVAVYNIEWI